MERKYKILAFIILVKKWRKNSFILRYENKVEYAKNIGISYTSYKKYLQLAIETGVIRSVGEHYQAIGFVEALGVLGLKDKIRRINSVYNNHDYETVNFKNVYERIIESVVISNFERQQHLIDRNQVLFSRDKDDSIKKAKRKIIQRLARKAGELGVSTDSILSDIYKRKIDKVVTGKYHLSGLIGMSVSTGLRRLRRMDSDGVIERRVCNQIVECMPNFASYDILREQIRDTKMLPCRKGFIIFHGSEVKSILRGKNSYLHSYRIQRTSNTRLKKDSFLSPDKNIEVF